MPDNDVRDGLARALFAARLADGDYPDGTGGWDDVPEDWREACQVLADAALAYLAGQGEVVAEALRVHRFLSAGSQDAYLGTCACSGKGYYDEPDSTPEQHRTHRAAAVLAALTGAGS